MAKELSEAEQLEELQKKRGDFILMNPEEEEESTESEELEEESEETEENEENEEDPAETEETEEDPAETEELEEDIKSSKPSEIPRSRLNAVIAQREAEKERVQWLEERLEALIDKGMGNNTQTTEIKEEYDFSKAEGDYADFLMAGETSKAATLRTEITKEQTRAITEQFSELNKQNTEQNTKATTEAVEGIKFDAVVETLESQNSFLDVSSDDYNEEATDTVNSLMNGYIQNGMSKTESLKLAVERIAPMYNTTEEVQESKKARGVKAKARGVKTSNAQPPEAPTGTKISTTDTDVLPSKMSDKELKSLTAKERALLRGDII